MLESTEQVLVVERKILDAVCPRAFNTNVAEARAAITPAAHFRVRHSVEKDFAFKQIIPYVVASWRDKYLRIRRLPKQTETRLHNRYSIGIGGHINNQDDPQTDLIEAGMRRELNEEIRFPNTQDCELIAILNDDTEEIDRVHVAFVYRLRCPTPEFEVGEKDEHEAMWTSVEGLEQAYPSMESWSKRVYENLIRQR